MKLTLKIWRQKNRKTPGKFVSYPVDGGECGDVDARSHRRAERNAD